MSESDLLGDDDVVDGWTVADPAAYRYVTENDPPRPGSTLRMLRMDSRSPEVRRIWWISAAWFCVGSAVSGIGAAVEEIEVLVLGAVWALLGIARLGVYLWLLSGAVRILSSGRLVRGEIRSLRRHPMRRGCSTATAYLPDGHRVAASVTTTTASELIERDGRAEVLILTADGRGGWGIGLRAAGGPTDSSGGHP